jgi:ferredoxin
MIRSLAAVQRTAAAGRGISRSSLVRPSPERETELLRDKAAELGLSAIGIAKYDEKYTVEPYIGCQVGDSVIVCVLEQNYAATQTIPSPSAERAEFHAYVELMDRATKLAQYLHQRGHRAEVHPADGPYIILHYAVASGLGQLGLNGQLLTPHAGSRCRLVAITADAPLVHDHPVDYGIHKICDQCQACVRRCPSGAIPANRSYNRGVEKAKINPKRCLPVVAQAEGCAICMKVCPVQRYGLKRVFEHYELTGDILGKESSELEGYVWPLDGVTYLPGSRPRLSRKFFFELD